MSEGRGVKQWEKGVAFQYISGIGATSVESDVSVGERGTIVAGWQVCSFFRGEKQVR